MIDQIEKGRDLTLAETKLGLDDMVNGHQDTVFPGSFGCMRS